MLIMRCNPLILALFCLSLSLAPQAKAQSSLFDFESGSAPGWQTLDPDMPVSVWEQADTKELHGRYHLTTLYHQHGKTDAPIGTWISPPFVVNAAPMLLRVGGGGHPETYVALCCANGTELLTARGAFSTTMHVVEWDLTPWIGETLFLKIVDRHSGGWGHITLDDVRVDAAVLPQSAETAEAFRVQQASNIRRTELEAKLAAYPWAALENAVGFLTRSYPAAYATDWSERVQALHQRTEAFARSVALPTPANTPSVAELESVSDELARLQRDALLANPLLHAAPILFVRRPQYLPDHHNTATMFVSGEINTGSYRGGGALMRLDPRADFAPSTLFDPGPDAMIRDPEVSWDGTRILFAMRRGIQDDYHIYEIPADGGSPRQLTHAAGFADIDPFYPPDGRIGFTSTREPKYCMCNRHIMGNLYVMDADGANIHQIGKSTLHEGHGSMLPDGRILYDRWEYVDRNFGDAQGLWAVRPDGTAHAVIYGNNSPSGGVIDARAVPGTQWICTILTSCHDRPWGSVALLDIARGVDNAEPVLRTWPPSSIDLIRPDANDYWDAFLGTSPKYEDPFPLSPEFFLVSRLVGPQDKTALALIDTFGNETIVYEEPELGCFDPMPLAQRTRPLELPMNRDFENQKGSFYVYDVYQGSVMGTVPRGIVKYLRVVESPEKRFWTNPSWDGQGVHCPAMNWHGFENKRVLGTVPVEADGSAYFEAPADTFLYFQLLDERKMMIQSMRSGTIVQSGETQGCVGCHDERLGETAPTDISPARCAAHPIPARTQQLHRNPELPRRYPTDLRPELRRMPRLRQAGRRKAPAGGRQDPRIQRVLHRSLVRRLSQQRRRRPRTDPPRLLLGRAPKPPDPNPDQWPCTRTAEPQPGGTGAAHHLDRSERALLPDLRIRVVGQPTRTRTDRSRGIPTAGSVDPGALRPGPRSQQAHTDQLRSAGAEPMPRTDPTGSTGRPAGGARHHPTRQRTPEGTSTGRHAGLHPRSNRSAAAGAI